MPPSGWKIASWSAGSRNCGQRRITSAAPIRSWAMPNASMEAVYASRIPAPTLPRRARLSIPVVCTSGTPDSASTSRQAAYAGPVSAV